MIEKIQSLLLWMEKNLNRNGSFNSDDIRLFFAESFFIKTNSRIVHATPETYREYLYKLKTTLRGVRYEVEEFIESPHAVIVPFLIYLDFINKSSQTLRTISIFKMNKEGRIIEWREVFAKEGEENFDYDPGES